MTCDCVSPLRALRAWMQGGVLCLELEDASEVSIQPDELSILKNVGEPDAANVSLESDGTVLWWKDANVRLRVSDVVGHHVKRDPWSTYDSHRKSSLYERLSFPGFWVRTWEKLYPEITRFPSRHARIVAMGKARRESLMSIALVTAVVWTVASPALATFLDWLIPAPLYAIAAIHMLILYGILVGIPRLYSGRIRRALRRQLVVLGEPICVPCGYDLRGSHSGICPECGSEFVKVCPDCGREIKPK